mmetsp:Transcript_21804/g.32467  ORF Transcript_21804/g.32467 Transcript_21804/m.32467 type:complete len:321 (+) Transcript_21804:2-964(+)
MIHKVNKSWHVYLELPPVGVAPAIKFPKIPKSLKLSNSVNATHWYDGFSLFAGSLQINFNVDVNSGCPKFFSCCVNSMFQRQIGEIKKESDHIEGGAPTLIGEFGIPFNAPGPKDYSRHARLLDMNFKAMEKNIVHYTLWNYTPENDTKYGDQWNFEDLSIFTLGERKEGRYKLEGKMTEPEKIEVIRDDISKYVANFTLVNESQNRGSFLYSGGRALEAVIRPFPLATAGDIQLSCYSMDYQEYKLKFIRDPEIKEPTLIFVPFWPFVGGFNVTVSDGTFDLKVEKDNFAILSFQCPAEKKLVSITIAAPPGGCGCRCC